ncbi:MAG: transcription termination factor Rho [Acidobacteria bacterium]|nr:transcription termination factor Rho [Acidobacteriota bacterium]
MSEQQRQQQDQKPKRRRGRRRSRGGRGRRRGGHKRQPKFTPPNEEDTAALLENCHSIEYLFDAKPADLKAIAAELEVADTDGMAPDVLVQAVLHAQAEKHGLVYRDGVLDVLPDGYGFVRSAENSYLPGDQDIYVSPNQIRKFSLRTGDAVTGSVRPPKDDEKYFALVQIDEINSETPSAALDRGLFKNLTPHHPERQILVEGQEGEDPAGRVIDLLCPLGFGQRALIVSPPRAGKTILLKAIAHGLAENHPDVKLIVLLIDERPEEVTDMKRSVRGEVVCSTFDEPANRHVAVGDIVLNKARRLVESGHDVVILLDSLTRLARAHNTVTPSSGRVLSGGVDANALEKPKKFFGSARAFEEGGSLTIIATALIETGSRMDEVIFEEFKGTGNSEIVLERKLADKRIFPAIELNKSGTRKEELLLDPDSLQAMWMLRKALAAVPADEAMELLLKRLRQTKNNEEFLSSLSEGGVG